MAEDDRRDRRRDHTIPDGENPYIPPFYYVALIAVLALVVAATFL